MTARARRPFSIKVFLPGGTSDGVRVIGKSNWTGAGVVFPRALIDEAKTRPEFSRTGVYVLVGPPDDGDLPLVYVGEGENVGHRLRTHESKVDFWTWVIFFTSNDESLNKAHAKHLESRLVLLANRARRAKVLNKTQPPLPNLAEAESADVESFLSDMLDIFPLVGLTAFQEAAPAADPTEEPLFLSARKITARGYESAQGFVVLAGSHAARRETKSIHAYLTQLRQTLTDEGLFKADGEHWRLMQDYVFNSPSQAAAVMIGGNANGRIMWKDSGGRTLKERQEAAASGGEGVST